MTEYSTQVIEHYSNPRNPGTLPEATGWGQAGQGTNGELLIQFSIRAVEDVIEEARFRAFGCSASIASASATTELLIGRPLQQALALQGDDVQQALGGLPTHKQHCATYAAAAARAAVQDHITRAENG